MPEPLERHFANLDRLVALERDLAEARRERDEARAEVERLRAAIHEAQEQGARWAIERFNAGLGRMTVETDWSERICREARERGEHG